MRKIICALVIAGLSLALSACNNNERRVKIKDGAAVLADAGLKVTLPKGWVVFDTEESMNRNATMIWEFSGNYADYSKFEADVRPWDSRFLLYAERQGGGIALMLRVGEPPESMEVHEFACDLNNVVTELYKQGRYDVYGSLEPIPNSESTGIQGYISEVNIRESESDAERTRVLSDYIFIYKGDMYCMEICAEESAYDDGKNIQILPAEL